MRWLPSCKVYNLNHRRYIFLEHLFAKASSRRAPDFSIDKWRQPYIRLFSRSVNLVKASFVHSVAIVATPERVHAGQAASRSAAVVVKTQLAVLVI